MDILEANFPHRLPRKPTIAEVINAPCYIKFPGNRGVADDEASVPGRAVRCDKAFLDGILEQFKVVDLKAWMFGNRSGGHKYHDPLQHDPEEYLREALTIQHKILPELKRLKAHPELIGDARVMDWFFDQTAKHTTLAMGLIDLVYESRAMISRSQARIDAGESSAPVNPKTGEDFEPWESFGRRIPLITSSPAVQEIKQIVPDMRMVSAQQLPRSAVLLAERWRQKHDGIIIDIMRTSPHPEVVQKQLCGRDGAYVGEKIVDGQSALFKRPMPMIPRNETTSKLLAFGKQEHVAAMARYLALLEDDVTTQNRMPPAALALSFLSRDGMKKRLEDLLDGNDPE